jgi:hypothetical protein
MRGQTSSLGPSPARPTPRIPRQKTLLALTGFGFYVFASLAVVSKLAGALQQGQRVGAWLVSRPMTGLFAGSKPELAEGEGKWVSS